MTIHVPFETDKEGERLRLLRQLAQTHRETLNVITSELAKITSLSPEEITPHLHTMLAELVKPKDDPLCETATPQQRSRAFREWAESHRGMNLPHLSDDAVSRESMYDDERL